MSEHLNIGNHILFRSLEVLEGRKESLGFYDALAYHPTVPKIVYLLYTIAKGEDAIKSFLGPNQYAIG